MNIRRILSLAVAACLALLPLSVKAAGADKRPRVAVLSFPVAEGAWSGWGPGGWSAGEKRISSVLQDLMVTELSDQGSGKIRLIERERLEAILQEQKLGSSGLVDESSAVKMGKLAGVRYMVTGKVTRFAYKKSGFQTSGLVGALMSKVAPGGDSLARHAASDVNIKKASFTGRLDVRVIDVQTGEIIATVKDEGEVKDMGVKVAGTGNEVQWDQELVNKVFEPVVQRIAEKLVRRMADQD
nr:CsgG/HfaB family protein [uncultured Holophaga sp.]